MRTIKAARIYKTSPPQIDYKMIPENSLFIPEAVTANQFRSSFPDGAIGFVKASDAIPVQKVLAKQTIKVAQTLYSRADSTSFLKKTLMPGEKVNVLAYFSNYSYITTQSGENGWILKQKS